MTVPEVRRLVLAAVADDAERVFHLGWSRWRRAHQAVAQRCHVARRTRERTALPSQTPVPLVARGALTAVAFESVRSLLPARRPLTGRPRHDHRTILSGILWVLRTTPPWREMPARFGTWDTAYARYRLWRAQGLWQRLIDTSESAAETAGLVGISL